MHAVLVKELGEEPDRAEQLCRADYAKGYGRPDRKKGKKGSKKKPPARTG